MYQMKSSTLIGLVAVMLALATVRQAEAKKDSVTRFRQIVAVAKELESAELLMANKSGELAEKRGKLLYEFFREPKSATCDDSFNHFTKLANEFKIKAYQYVDDSKKSKNWFSSLAQKVAGPLGALKSMSQMSPYLAELPESYEAKSKSGQLTRLEVDCDLYKFQIKIIDSIMFLLQTDVKYLVTEDPAIKNRAIYEELKANKFVSTNNFYEINELTPTQQDLVLNYYVSRVDPHQTSIEEALRHYYKPSSYVIGRILDSCHFIPKLVDEWAKMESSRLDVCTKVKSSKENNLFISETYPAKYEQLVGFCKNFLEAL